MRHNSHTTYLLTTALVFVVTLNVTALNAAVRAAVPASDNAKIGATVEVPRLVVGIAVDQLRADYLLALQHLYGDGGLRRLLSEGRVYEHINVRIEGTDATAILTTLSTGAYPYTNGVPSRMVYDASLGREVSVFYDKDFIGNATQEHYSPHSLTASTLADELKMASDGASRVYSIAADAEAAIAAAGHTANCAIWLDDRTAAWASTTYYKDFPNYVQRQNSQPLFVELADAKWKASGRKEDLVLMPHHYEVSSFCHTFTEHGQIDVEGVKTSPIINDALVRMARLFLRNGALGQLKHTDMLHLTLYAGTYHHAAPERYPAELQDMYIRLDRNIADLLDAIDETVGLQHTYIYIYGGGSTDRQTSDIEGMRLGEFNANRCAALLNSHLISLYGQGQWVAGFHNGQIYLNRQTIEQGRLQLSDVQRAAADFVMLFSGVEEAVPACQLLHEDYSTRLARLRLAYDKRSGGDIMVTLLPGWVMRRDDMSKPEPQTRYDATPGIAIFFAPTVAAARVATPTEGTAIVPTVARHIRIRAPSACRTPALPDMGD